MFRRALLARDFSDRVTLYSIEQKTTRVTRHLVVPYSLRISFIGWRFVQDGKISDQKKDCDRKNELKRFHEEG